MKAQLVRVAIVMVSTTIRVVVVLVDDSRGHHVLDVDERIGASKLLHYLRETNHRYTDAVKQRPRQRLVGSEILLLLEETALIM